jgi:hypothetical protein
VYPICQPYFSPQDEATLNGKKSTIKIIVFRRSIKASVGIYNGVIPYRKSRENPYKQEQYRSSSVFIRDNSQRRSEAAYHDPAASAWYVMA